MADVRGEVNVEEPKSINVKVLGQDDVILQFKLKIHLPLRKLMEAYCDRLGVAMGSVRFLFDGQPIIGTDTPVTHEMEEGDTIEVYQKQIGGSHF